MHWTLILYNIRRSTKNNGNNIIGFLCLISEFFSHKRISLSLYYHNNTLSHREKPKAREPVLIVVLLDFVGGEERERGLICTVMEAGKERPCRPVGSVCSAASYCLLRKGGKAFKLIHTSSLKSQQSSRSCALVNPYYLFSALTFF